MITRFEVEGATIIMDGGLQDNTTIAVTPGTRTQEVLGWLDGAVDEYGVLMTPPDRVVPAGVGLHLAKMGKNVRGFFPDDIKSRDPKYK